MGLGEDEDYMIQRPDKRIVFGGLKKAQLEKDGEVASSEGIDEGVPSY